MQSFQFESLLNISKQKLWKAIWNFDNINKELAPYFKMTSPAIELTAIDINSIPLNEHLFTSYILLLKFLPIDIHYFKLKSIAENDYFEEESTSLILKYWRHTRTLEAKGEKTLLIDKIEYQHKIALLGKITFPIYKSVFSHRHKKLKALYN